MSSEIVYTMFLIFTGAALVSTAVLFTRQSLLVAYMLLGIIVGPYGFKLLSSSTLITQTGSIGIIFLLFLLGLNLHPQKLFLMLRKATAVTVISSIIFALMGFVIARVFGYTNVESLIVGAAMMFSSTIIGLKLLPTTILHHRHIGEVMISVLLLQDLLAIIVLLFLTGATEQGGLTWSNLLLTTIALPLLLLVGFLVEKYVLVKLLARFDHIKEYVFLLSIGWCLGMAMLANVLGLSEEIGAFIAGVSLAASPIALYIAESLKPLRDFFLVLFFFTIGAGFNLHYLPEVIIPTLVLSIAILVIKPTTFAWLFQSAREGKKISWEVGLRLAQASEFSLLIAYMAVTSQIPLIGDSANYLIQAATIVTFIVSSYWVVLRYPTPLALTDRMRKD
jgi:Kef-type K+ transport system membrane component KefB